MNAAKRPILLIVDDEPQIGAALLRMLHREPYEVVYCPSGAEALVFLETCEVTAVLCDIRMPDMTGVEFLQTLVQRYPATLRLVMTGDPGEYRGSDFNEMIGCYAIIEKPWNPLELKLLLRDALGIAQDMVV